MYSERKILATIICLALSVFGYCSCDDEKSENKSMHVIIILVYPDIPTTKIQDIKDIPFEVKRKIYNCIGKDGTPGHCDCNKLLCAKITSLMEWAANHSVATASLKLQQVNNKNSSTVEMRRISKYVKTRALVKNLRRPRRYYRRRRDTNAVDEEDYKPFIKRFSNDYPPIYHAFPPKQKIHFNNIDRYYNPPIQRQDEIMHELQDQLKESESMFNGPFKFRSLLKKTKKRKELNTESGDGTDNTQDSKSTQQPCSETTRRTTEGQTDENMMPITTTQKFDPNSTTTDYMETSKTGTSQETIEGAEADGYTSDQYDTSRTEVTEITESETSDAHIEYTDTVTNNVGNCSSRTTTLCPKTECSKTSNGHTNLTTLEGMKLTSETSKSATEYTSSTTEYAKSTNEYTRLTTENTKSTYEGMKTNTEYTKPGTTESGASFANTESNYTIKHYNEGNGTNGTNGTTNTTQTPPQEGDNFQDILCIMQSIKSQFLNEFLQPMQGMSKSDAQGEPPRPALLPLVKNMFTKLATTKKDNIALIKAGTLSDLNNTKSELMATLRYLRKKKDSNNTLLIVTAECPPKVNRAEKQCSSTKSITTVPLYVSGPQQERFMQARQICDVFDIVKQQMDEKMCDEQQQHKTTEWRRGAEQYPMGYYENERELAEALVEPKYFPDFDTDLDYGEEGAIKRKRAIETEDMETTVNAGNLLLARLTISFICFVIFRTVF